MPNTREDRRKRREAHAYVDDHCRDAEGKLTLNSIVDVMMYQMSLTRDERQQLHADLRERNNATA